MAAKSGDLDTVKECIQNGVDINVTSPVSCEFIFYIVKDQALDTFLLHLENS